MVAPRWTTTIIGMVFLFGRTLSAPNGCTETCGYKSAFESLPDTPTRPGNWTEHNQHRTDGGHGVVHEERGQYVNGPQRTTFYKKNYTSSYGSVNGQPIDTENLRKIHDQFRIKMEENLKGYQHKSQSESLDNEQQIFTSPQVVQHYSKNYTSSSYQQSGVPIDTDLNHRLQFNVDTENKMHSNHQQTSHSNYDTNERHRVHSMEYPRPVAGIQETPILVQSVGYQRPGGIQENHRTEEQTSSHRVHSMEYQRPVARVQETPILVQSVEYQRPGGIQENHRTQEQSSHRVQSMEYQRPMAGVQETPISIQSVEYQRPGGRQENHRTQEQSSSHRVHSMEYQRPVARVQETPILVQSVEYQRPGGIQGQQSARSSYEINGQIHTEPGLIRPRPYNRQESANYENNEKKESDVIYSNLQPVHNSGASSYAHHSQWSSSSSYSENHRGAEYSSRRESGNGGINSKDNSMSTVKYVQSPGTLNIGVIDLGTGGGETSTDCNQESGRRYKRNVKSSSRNKHRSYEDEETKIKKLDEEGIHDSYDRLKFMANHQEYDDINQKTSGKLRTNDNHHFDEIEEAEDSTRSRGLDVRKPPEITTTSGVSVKTNDETTTFIPINVREQGDFVKTSSGDFLLRKKLHDEDYDHYDDDDDDCEETFVPPMTEYVEFGRRINQKTRDYKVVNVNQGKKDDRLIKETQTDKAVKIEKLDLKQTMEKIDETSVGEELGGKLKFEKHGSDNLAKKEENLEPKTIGEELQGKLEFEKLDGENLEKKVDLKELQEQKTIGEDLDGKFKLEKHNGENLEEKLDLKELQEQKTIGEDLEGKFKFEKHSGENLEKKVDFKELQEQKREENLEQKTIGEELEGKLKLEKHSGENLEKKIDLKESQEQMKIEEQKPIGEELQGKLEFEKLGGENLEKKVDLKESQEQKPEENLEQKTIGEELEGKLKFEKHSGENLEKQVDLKESQEQKTIDEELDGKFKLEKHNGENLETKIDLKESQEKMKIKEQKTIGEELQGKLEFEKLGRETLEKKVDLKESQEEKTIGEEPTGKLDLKELQKPIKMEEGLKNLEQKTIDEDLGGKLDREEAQKELKIEEHRLEKNEENLEQKTIGEELNHSVKSKENIEEKELRHHKNDERVFEIKVFDQKVEEKDSIIEEKQKENSKKINVGEEQTVRLDVQKEKMLTHKIEKTHHVVKDEQVLELKVLDKKINIGEERTVRLDKQKEQILTQKTTENAGESLTGISELEQKIEKIHHVDERLKGKLELEQKKPVLTQKVEQSEDDWTEHDQMFIPDENLSGRFVKDKIRNPPVIDEHRKYSWHHFQDSRERDTDRTYEFHRQPDSEYDSPWYHWNEERKNRYPLVQRHWKESTSESDFETNRRNVGVKGKSVGRNWHRDSTHENLQLGPRILEAYGAGSYNLPREEDEYDKATVNPDLALPPYDNGFDSWDIREKEIQIIENSTTTQRPNGFTSFWHKIKNKVSNAVRKTKEEVKEILG